MILYRADCRQTERNLNNTVNTTMETNISLSHLKEPEFFPEIWKTMMTGELIGLFIKNKTLKYFFFRSCGLC